MENLDFDVLRMRCHRQWRSGMMLVGLRDMNWARWFIKGRGHLGMSQDTEEKRSQISNAAKNWRHHYNNDNTEKQK